LFSGVILNALFVFNEIGGVGFDLSETKELHRVERKVSGGRRGQFFHSRVDCAPEGGNYVQRGAIDFWFSVG
jgi:hypothetical protein